MKSFAKKLITVSLLSLGLCHVAFGADGKDHHDPLLFWSWGQSGRVPLPPIEPRQVDPAVKEAMRLFAERLRQQHGQQADAGSSSSSSTSATSKRRLEKSEDTGETHERAAKTQKIGLSQEELLKNAAVISIAEFTEDKLRVARESLKQVGVLKIMPNPGVQANIANLIKLIEKYFPNILQLYYADVEIGDEGFEALARSNIAAQLRSLSIARSRVTARSFTVENLNRFKSLESLDATANTLGDAGFDALAKSDMATGLKQLYIQQWGVTHRSFTVENLNKFKNLDLLAASINPIGDAGFEALAESDIAPQLKIIGIQHNMVSAQSFTTKNLNRFKSMQELLISANPLGDAGFEALAQSDIASQLKKLFAILCGITGRSFTVENLNRFKSLNVLDISHNTLGPSAFLDLVNSSLSETLQTLAIAHTGLPAAATISLLKERAGLLPLQSR